MEKLLYISLVFLSLVISFSEAELGIFGGNPVDIRDAPYQAAYYSRGLFECGATILGEKCVLTSGDTCNSYLIICVTYASNRILCNHLP